MGEWGGVGAASDNSISSLPRPWLVFRSTEACGSAGHWVVRGPSGVLERAEKVEQGGERTCGDENL